MMARAGSGRAPRRTMLFLGGRCGEGVAVQEYDLIILGSGSGMNFVDALIQENPKIRIAVIDKDEPGGICLTRGCIPSKIMVYPAELVRMELKKRPESIAIIGGGYIAAEFGHFFSAVGTKVTIIGRNPHFLPEEEPEVSALAKRELGRHIQILTGHEVREVEEIPPGSKRLHLVERQTGQTKTLDAQEVMVAAGRGPETDLLHPERGGVKLTKDGWIETDV